MTTEASETSTASTNAGDTTQTTAADQTAATETSTEVKGDANAQTKTQDDAGKGDGAKADEPVVYDFKLPEGVELDGAAADKFKAVAAELKLPADGAQKVVDLYAGLKQAEAEAFKSQVEAWGNEVRADKEIGGAKLDENLATARKAVDTFGTPELKSLLNSTGMGNHPEVVKLMVKIGKAISEDGVVRGNPAEQKPKDAASVLYGTTQA